MGDKTFLLADAVHINEKNFKSLLNFCTIRNVDFVRPELKALPIDAFGNYESHRKVLASERTMLEGLSAADLFEFSVSGVQVFETCRAELMSLLVCASVDWRNHPFPNNQRELFDRIISLNFDELIDNMAAACLWIKFWHTTTKSTPRLAYVGVFSGSLTYARALLEIMRFHPGRCFVMESFFTGMHFYCEERYDPIANRSDVKLKTILRSIDKHLNQNTYEIKRNAVHKLLQGIKNKNVTQPQATGERLFNNCKPTLLITGQVLNDFSLLESSDCGINSLDTYRQLIRKVLTNTQWNCVYKAHPWERKKHNLFQALTLDELSAEFSKNPRVALVEDHSLTDLFQEVDGVLCINSQSGIEAALAGFKPIQVGNAFWGNNGFSHDVEPAQLDKVLQILCNPLDCRADLVAYENLEGWLVTIIDGWLIEETSGVKADMRLKEIFWEIAQRAPNASVSIKPLADHSPQTQVKSRSLMIGTIPINTVPITGLRYSLRRKLRKLVNRPAEFFRDAKSKAVRRAGLFIFARDKK